MRKKTSEIMGDEISVMKMPQQNTAIAGVPQRIPFAGMLSSITFIATKDNTKPSSMALAKMKYNGTDIIRVTRSIDTMIWEIGAIKINNTYISGFLIDTFSTQKVTRLSVK
jgi:hypothetical protein